MRYLFCIICIIFLCNLTISQTTDSPVVRTDASNKVLNLELPPNQEVKHDEGFVLIKAECKGLVKWLVICPKPVKYIAYEQNNTLIVGVPQSGSVTVFAVGLFENKMTEFAKTVITVKEPPKVVKEMPKVEPQPLRW